MHVHLIGICGSGLSAIARILLEKGFTVSGSDRAFAPSASILEAAGARVYTGHKSEYVLNADVVVQSSAIPDTNPEVQEALRLGIPVQKRSEFLGALLVEYRCIAVAGTHGKTTTTAMIAWMLKELGQDPSYIIGGVSANLGGNAHAGKGNLFVIEADEYDRMFLGLKPEVAVITNLEFDHPDCYPTPEDYAEAFHQFVLGIKPGGILVACDDNPGSAHLRQVVQAAGLRTTGYGLGELGTHFQRQEHMLRNLVVPGEHNILNALAAMTVAEALNLPIDRAAAALQKYSGVGRRFELRGEAGGITIIDDYAHHPTEIRATLAAACQRYHGRRLWAVWQPHTYSRTRELFSDFVIAFNDADYVVVTDIFAARETAPEDGFSAGQVAEAIALQGEGQAFYIPGLDQVQDFLLERLDPGDVLLVLSAGDADAVSEGVLRRLKIFFSGRSM